MKHIEVEMLSRRLKFSCVGVCAALLAEPAHAYIDPGTGSMLVQMIIAGVAGSFTVIGLYWSKLKGFFRRERKSKKADRD